MTADLKSQLKKHLDEQNFLAFKQEIDALLAADEASGLDTLQKLIPSAGSTIRQALLMHFRTAPSMIWLPLIETILREESNVLVLRKMMSELATWPFPEMIDLLESIEARLPAEVKRVCSRTLGKLKAHFREYHYIKEFERGSGNLKRLKAAADAMIREPHPQYRSFLERALMVEDNEMRKEAIRVLLVLGNGASLEPMFLALQQLILEEDRSRFLAELSLPDPPVGDLDFQGLLAAVVAYPHSLYEKEDLPDLVAGSNALSPSGKADMLLNGFGIEAKAVQDPAQRFLTDWFSGSSVVNKSGLKNYYQTWLLHADSCLEILNDLCLAMGRTSSEYGMDDFSKRLEAAIPAQFQERESLIISSLAGRRDQDAQEKLLEYLRDSSHAAQTRRILDALVKLTLDKIPEPIVALAQDTENGILRKKALEVIAAGVEAETLLRGLLKSKPLVVVADTVCCICENQISGCYPDLTELLQSDIPESVQLVILENLVFFEKMNLAEPVAPFLALPRSEKVRLRALDTLMENNLVAHLHPVLEMLAKYPQDKLEAAVVRLLDHLMSFPFDEHETLLLEHPDFWQRCLKHPSESVRIAAIATLDRCRFSHCDPQVWVDTIHQALNSLKDQRSQTEQEKLRVFLHRITAHLELIRKKEHMKQQLDQVVERMELPSQFEKVQALREFNHIFKPEMLEENKPALKRIVNTLYAFLPTVEDSYKMLILGIDACALVNHPVLRKRIAPYQDHANWGVAQAAKRAMERPIDPALRENLIRSVFVMDDSHYITDLVSRILETKSFEVVTANDPVAAVEVFKERHFDLLLLDLNMPGLTGAQFLTKVRETGIHPDFVMLLTGNRNKEDLMEVFRQGVDGVILKPFHPKDILNRIYDLVNKYFEE